MKKNKELDICIKMLREEKNSMNETKKEVESNLINIESKIDELNLNKQEYKNEKKYIFKNVIKNIFEITLTTFILALPFKFLGDYKVISNSLISIVDILSKLFIFGVNGMLILLSVVEVHDLRKEFKKNNDIDIEDLEKNKEELGEYLKNLKSKINNVDFKIEKILNASENVEYNNYQNNNNLEKNKTKIKKI